MIRRLLRTMVPLVLLAVSCSNGGTEWISEDTGVSFQLPRSADWSQVPNPRSQAKLTLHGPESSAIVFIAFQRRPGEVLNEGVVKRWEEEFYSSGRTKKVAGEFFTFKGRKAYKALAKRPREEVMESWTVILWIENERMLEIAATRANADPLEAPVINEFVESIKFLRTPTNGLTNPQGGANERQPFSPETNRASAAAASRRSP